ncbi:teichoic acid transport system ATP-binding protein [Lachnotalea glycerini]|uniref:ABC transporter ATP-binding protein n=1 Tax=Lachnotalea glycerini TaxID=1763509 RepID=A0A255HZ64_9FIRM|nr:ABC transporter ATP-binding protein [Lachnotalea glycerini]PXV87281.1 teichoic acid transport system ATP-binding protein [Lachnotalea glycerini]RDY26688.1 ABC transporter ATP-binding protein [Lachnotalea glycerini]
MFAIRVNNLSKVYNLYEKPIDRLKETLSPFKRIYHKSFYALNDISFDVEQGETVGIVGTNGSGKSTILKIITGVLTPTQGSVEIKGKISALLELGAGFNMEYTGIENIYLNGTMMGFTKKEMEEKLKDILDFADIGDFVYQPVKTYSSGMLVRLAFATAINVEPEILIVDEALSVGDVFFQAKCFNKINEIKQKGTTILLVTHDMSSIIKYCDKAILLNRGNFVEEGKPNKIVDLYKKILANQYDPNKTEATVEAAAIQVDGKKKWMSQLSVNPEQNIYGDKRAEIVDVGLFDEQERLTNLIMKGKEFTIKMKVKFNETISEPIFAFTIKDTKGTELAGTNTLVENTGIRMVEAGKTYVVSFTQKMMLQGKDYLISLGCTGFENGEFVIYDRMYDVINISVISNKNTVGVYDMDSAVVFDEE